MNYIWDNKHFIITHFPIVLLLFSFLFDLAGLIWKKREWHSSALVCLVVGTLSTIAAVLTGPQMMRNSDVETHEMYGKLTMILAIVLCVVRIGIWLWKKKDVGRSPIYLIASLVAVVLVMYTGHLGGKMVHRPFNPGQFQQGQLGGGTGEMRGGGPGQNGQDRMQGGGQATGGQAPGDNGTAQPANSTNP
ncbi:DUF2231 domain-containing protein [Gorillibacterium massiliense]|uniref:DUF2231 domain-containing protein n=1 Tax=Gorillibacterium massiliense TaxID=1280390 RepID=UPI0004BC5FC8|nr:DUF2231 domain-containing protein [Gorillibacterium massiliense]